MQSVSSRQLALGLALGLALVGSAQAESNELGRNLAATCANCHGTDGRAVGDGARLAGMPAANLVKTMQQFAEGKKAATIMHQLAKGYTPAQIQAIADYFAAQK